MLQHSRNRPVATDEKTRKVFSVLVVISPVGTISRKNIKFVATGCHILKLKCTKFNFGWGYTGGAYSTPPDPLAAVKGLLLRGKRGRNGPRGDFSCCSGKEAIEWV